MKLEVVDTDKAGASVREPYVVRLPGWTWDRYLREAPEMRFCEYVEGELIMPSPVDWRHQQLVGFLTWLLKTFCLNRRLGEVGNGPAVIKVAPEHGREPDIFVLPPEEAAKAHGMPIEAIPSLIVEVSSPSTRTMDLVEKAEDYARFGVREYWVVDAARHEVHAHTLAGGAYRRRTLTGGKLESAAVAGFWIRVEWLWQDPLPAEPACLREIEGAGV